MVTEEKKNALKEVLDYLSFATDMIVERFGEKHPEWAWIYALLVDYYEEAYKAKDTGKPVAWINFGVPPELLCNGYNACCYGCFNWLTRIHRERNKIY